MRNQLASETNSYRREVLKSEIKTYQNKLENILEQLSKIDPQYARKIEESKLLEQQMKADGDLRTQMQRDVINNRDKLLYIKHRRPTLKLSAFKRAQSGPPQESHDVQVERQQNERTLRDGYIRQPVVSQNNKEVGTRNYGIASPSERDRYRYNAEKLKEEQEKKRKTISKRER